MHCPLRCTDGTSSPSFRADPLTVRIPCRRPTPTPHPVCFFSFLRLRQPSATTRCSRSLRESSRRCSRASPTRRSGSATWRSSAPSRHHPAECFLRRVVSLQVGLSALVNGRSYGAKRSFAPRALQTPLRFTRGWSDSSHLTHPRCSCFPWCSAVGRRTNNALLDLEMAGPQGFDITAVLAVVRTSISAGKEPTRLAALRRARQRRPALWRRSRLPRRS